MLNVPNLLALSQQIGMLPIQLPRVFSSQGSFFLCCPIDGHFSPLFPWITTSFFFTHHLLLSFQLLSTLFPFVKSIFILVCCFLAVPPQPPVILGLEREEVKAGRMLVLKCVSHSGNPLATLHWTKVNLLHHLLRRFVTHCHIAKMNHNNWRTCSVGIPLLVASVLHLLHHMKQTHSWWLFEFYVFICVSEWGSSVHNLGRGCCVTEVHRYPQPEDHPCWQPGSAVLWKHQSGVPVASVCQPQNHCALWVKIMLNIEHNDGAHMLTHTQSPGGTCSNGLLRIWTWGRGI